MLRQPTSALHFVGGNNPLPTIEVHEESVEVAGFSVHQVVTDVLTQFAAQNPEARATVYLHGTVSVNFHERAWSEYLIVAGSQRLLETLATGFSRLAGVKSRISDYLPPSAGIIAFHVEEGRLWEPEDAVTWYANTPGTTAELCADERLDEVPEEDWDDDSADQEPIGSTGDEALVRQIVRKAARYRAARSDAKVGRIRQEIERVFGLPAGSVALRGPDGRPLRGDAMISTLRRRWDEA